MKQKRIGKLPPKYSFILNQYQYERISSCPLCKKLTHPRKFPLFIHVTDWGPLVMGKTCKYCSRCELIVAHQHELEAEMAFAFSQLAPAMIGNDYLVVGTVEKKFWQQGMQGTTELDNTLDHVADFRKVYDLKIEPGGWYPKDEPRK